MNNFITKIKNELNSSNFLIDAKLRSKLSPNNTLPPRLYGLLKVHKSDIFEDIPIRPVVAFTNSPVYNLTKWLNLLLKEVLDNYFTFTVRNSIELSKKLKERVLHPREILLSLDVTSLFTNVPRTEVLQILDGFLISINYHPGKKIELLRLVDVCLKQSFFQYNNKLYDQPSGLAMGSPISPILADLFMHHFESTYIMSNNPFVDNINFTPDMSMTFLSYGWALRKTYWTLCLH